MLYYLFDFFENVFQLPGASVFQYISFRAAMAVIMSLMITMIFGKKIINMLLKKQVGETVRNLGLKGEERKSGTPTMGGLIIIMAILLPTLLFARLDNIYIILMLITTIWMGVIGFMDDYIKVFKKNKDGIAGKFKIIGQVGLGLLVGGVMYFHPDVIIHENNQSVVIEKIEDGTVLKKEINQHGTKSTKTTIPFFKNNEFDYATLVNWMGDNAKKWVWIIFIPIIIFIISAVSNGANLTDGLDGLATGTSAIIGATLGIFAYVSGNIIFSNYLNIMHIPDVGELVIFIAAFVGACIGFLWYNAYPAQVFMGDTGSLTIGGIIAVFAIVIRKELLIPVLCGIYLVENLSVILQVTYFRYTKTKFGKGIRLFRMSPLHHHYQKKGMHESKIVVRFWLIGILLAILTFITLKLR